MLFISFQQFVSLTTPFSLNKTVIIIESYDNKYSFYNHKYKFCQLLLFAIILHYIIYLNKHINVK